MKLPRRGLKFHRITYHVNVTQCLGGLNPPGPWYMAVSRPSGGVQNYPRPEDITVFKIPHGCYVKMEMGTWHAGASCARERRGAHRCDSWHTALWGGRGARRAAAQSGRAQRGAEAGAERAHARFAEIPTTNTNGRSRAGPLFDQSEFMDFYNLELKDTNVVDHNTHDYKKSNGMEFSVLPV